MIHHLPTFLPNSLGYPNEAGSNPLSTKKFFSYKFSDIFLNFLKQQHRAIPSTIKARPNLVYLLFSSTIHGATPSSTTIYSSMLKPIHFIGPDNAKHNFGFCIITFSINSSIKNLILLCDFQKFAKSLI
ncbi:Uncharacterised protein [Orientia tsutsugamushi]|nr:hypothetical protein OTSTA763_0650 [Orientia tsutsugamushi str. TA763]SPP24032.1 Uncharacterised protein [Orientia tsutsugamushi]